MFTDKEDSGRGITTGTDKEFQSRNEARIPQNTKRSTNISSWSTRVWDDWLKNGTSYHEIDEPPTKKIRECGAKETQLSLILVIIASCFEIFLISICNFVLYEKLMKMRGN